MAASATTMSTTAIERAILVTNIPYVCDDSEELRDKLKLYFGKAKHGGGEIEKVVCPIAGSMSKAILVFESEKVRKKIMEHESHIFKDEVITVQSLPPIFSDITVKVDRYYFDIIPREAASEFINTLKTQLGEDNISGGKCVIDTLSGSLDELEALREIILKTAGIGAANVTTASSVTSEWISRGVDVGDIPFVTEDVDKLKEYLRRSAGSQLDDVMTPVGGSTQRAILIFKSVAEKDKYCQQASHPFHGSEGEELSIHDLPRIFSDITVEVDRYYFDIIPREAASELINTLKTQLGEDNISGGKCVIDTLSGSLDELEALREIIPKTAGIGAANVTTASSVTSEWISRGVDVGDIPFVTEDVDKLKEYLRRSAGLQLDDVMTPVGGSTQRAILIFKTVAEKDKYCQQANHPFHGSEGEELSIHDLPRVFKTAAATLDTMYTHLIPRSKRSLVTAKLYEMGNTDVVINGNKMTAATIEQLRDAVDEWTDALGLPSTIQAEFESKTSEASVNRPNVTKYDESSPQISAAGHE